MSDVEPQPFLPRFSDPRDVDEFVDKLERFERGEISPEDFKRFRLTRGVYGQRQSDAQMRQHLNPLFRCPTSTHRVPRAPR